MRFDQSKPSTLLPPPPPAQNLNTIEALLDKVKRLEEENRILKGRLEEKVVEEIETVRESNLEQNDGRKGLESF